MTIDHRLSRLERDLGAPPGERKVRSVMVLYDINARLVDGELDAFLGVVSPDRDAVVVMLGDNGRDPGVFSSVTISGDGWRGTPLPIGGGRIIGDWKGGA
jgi:hypothetical protein